MIDTALAVLSNNFLEQKLLCYPPESKVFSSLAISSSHFHNSVQSTSETRKVCICAACHYWNQQAETGIESLRSLYSDGQGSEKMGGWGQLPVIFYLGPVSCVLGNFLYLCPGRLDVFLEHSGSDTILIAYGVLWSTKVELLVVSRSQRLESIRLDFQFLKQ